MGPPRTNLCSMCGRAFKSNQLSWLNWTLCGVMLIFIILKWVIGTVAGLGPYLILLIPIGALAFVHMRWVGLVSKKDRDLEI
jgi:hypothetical protein